MNQAQRIIAGITNAKKLEDILDVNNIKSEYRDMLKVIYPDMCTEAGAKEATQKLTTLKEEFDKGKTHVCEVGEFTTNNYFLTFKGNDIALKQSLKNYQILKSLKDANSLHFHQYLPKNMTLDEEGLHIQHPIRTIPITDLQLPQEHVNWILNRMLEFSAWIEQVGYVHCGIHPESIFIIPETHGIQVCLFPHMTKVDNKIGTISGAYQNWYPANVFSKKTASSDIDVELSKKTAIYLLGDKSGSGIKLKRTHNQKFIDFVVKRHNEANTAFLEYRELLQNNFKKGFYKLDI